MAGPSLLAYFSLVYLLCSPTTIYCEEVNIKTVPYTPDGVYSVGDTQIRIDEIVAVAEYRHIVSCPNYSGSTVDDIVDIIERFRCPGGAGKDFNPTAYTSPQVYMEWGGWNDCKRDLDPKGIFRCFEAHDGLSHGCAHGDAMHCIHLKSRKVIPELRIGSRKTTWIEIAYYDQSDTKQKHAIDIVTVGKINIKPKIVSDWPHQMAFGDNGAFIDDTLKASQYAAANCPVHKPYNETEWIINSSKFHTHYVVGLGWDVSMEWYGTPKGSVIRTVTNFDGIMEVKAPITTGTLEITGPKEAIAYLKENTSKDCEILYCNRADVGEGIGVDALQGHHGRPVMVLTSPNSNKIGEKQVTGCELKDERNIKYVVQPSKKTILFTMADTLKTNKGLVRCPPPTSMEYDEFYGMNMNKIAARTGGAISVSSVLEELRLPSIFSVKNILLTCSVIIALYFRLNTIGLIIAMVIGFIAMSQPAAAMDAGVLEVLQVAETCMTPVSWITRRSFVRFISLILCIATYAHRRRAHNIISVLINGTCYFSDNLAYGQEIGLCLIVVYYKVQDPEFQDWLEEAIDRCAYETHFITGAKSPMLEPIIPPMAPREHSIIGRPTTSYRFVSNEAEKSTSKDEPCKVRNIDADVIIVTKSPNTRDRAKRAMARRRQGVKAFNKHILYEEEFIALREILLKLDQASIAKIYAAAVRVHGRKPWDLESFLQCLKDQSMKDSIIERANKEYW